MLYFLWVRAFRGHLRLPGSFAVLWALGFCLMLAVLDECYQSLVGSRIGSIQDVALDLAGSGLAAMLTAAFKALGLRSGQT